MTVKYASKFKANYEKLPPDVQRRFFFVDASVTKGDLSLLRAEPFDRYVTYLGVDHAAYGKLLKGGTVFLWIFIGGKDQVPVTL